MRKWIGPDQARPAQDCQSGAQSSPTFRWDWTGLSPTPDRVRPDWWNHCSEFAIGQKLPAENSTPLETQLSQAGYQQDYYAGYQADSRAGFQSPVGSRSDWLQWYVLYRYHHEDWGQ